MMRGGPHDGRIMAYGGPVMPVLSEGGRIGTYIWDEDHWEYERETSDDKNTD
jgi:hypothetical protein